MSGTKLYYPILLIVLVLAGCQQKPAEEKAEPATLTAERPGPAISVTPTTFDFGRMNQNDSRSTEIVIKNVGTDSLHIHNIIAACGCTVTSLQTRVIGPGKSTVLGIHFDSKKLSGHQNKTVIIESDDPENPQFDIAITADVHLPIQTNPQKHFLSNRRIPLGEQWSEQITFSTEDVPELQIEALEYNTEVLSVQIENGIDGDSQASIMTVATQQIQDTADASALAGAADLPDSMVADTTLQQIVSANNENAPWEVEVQPAQDQPTPNPTSMLRIPARSRPWLRS